MRELSFPSRLPGWALIIGVMMAGFLGAHVSLAAFAHHALGHPDSWIWHVENGEGWQAFGVLVRCTSSGLFGLSPVARRPVTPYQGWCRQWWRAFDLWTRGIGSSFFGATMVLMTVVGAGAYLYVLRRLVPRGPERRRTTTYAGREELRPFLRPRGTSRAEMLNAGALTLGRTVPEDGRGRGVDLWIPLQYRRQHIWVLGVTGVGKTSGIIKRWLASDAALDGVSSPVKMSTVAVDVKDPDLWEFAAPVAMRYDRRVIRWCPMSPDTMGHNFLDYVHTVGDTVEMAETILSNDTEYNRKDPFWRQTELNMLATTLQLVCEEPADRLMPDLLREKLQNILGVVPPPRSLAFILGLSHLHPSEFMAYIERVDGTRTVWRDRFSKVFQARDDKTIGAWQGLQNVLVIFRDRDVIAATSRSDFDLSVVARQPTTLIVGLPRKPGSRRQVLTALFFRQLLQLLDDIIRERGTQELPVPVTFLLDELGVLGLIPTFQDFVATYRDMGVSFVIATQDRAQLIDVYGEEKADTIIANLHTRIVFGRDLRPEQAEEICRALGETIVPEPGLHYEHRSPLTVVRRGTRLTYQVRRLLEPNELRALPEFRAVAVLPGDVKAHVELHPVHADRVYQRSAPKVSSVETLRHDLRMDRVLGRLTATPRVTHGTPTSPREDALPPPPEMLQPLRSSEETAHMAPGELAAVHESPSSTAESLGDFQQSGQLTPVRATGPTSNGGRVEAAALGELAASDSDGATQPPPTGKQRTGHGKATSAPPSGESGSSTAIATEHPQIIGSPLAAFIVEVLHGSLRDDRLLPGSPRGWIFEDKHGEFLVPWGFLRDWAFKTRRRFTDLEATWTRDGLVRGRASVTANGRSITCLLFSKTAAQLFPGDLQRLLAQSFAKVAPMDVRLSTARAVKDWGQDLAAGGADDGTPHEVLERTAPPRLAEFLQALEQVGIHFIGHPARHGEAPVYGRWRAGSKGGEVILVERNAAKAIFDLVGVADPAQVLTLWKQAGILYLGGQVRSGFYTRRTHPEGNEFLALRWDRALGYLPAKREGTLGS